MSASYIVWRRLSGKYADPLNTLKSRLRLGNYWVWLPDAEDTSDLEIWPLVYPLRYDILIRKTFFDFYAEQRRLFEEDFPAFMTKVKYHQYYEWFRNVLVVRYEPHLLNNATALEGAFKERVLAAVRLYDSIESMGFDKSRPIVPYTGNIIMPADTGRVTGEMLYAGDGCHRLACLMAMGYKRLPRSYVRIKCFKRFIPLDNTRLLSSSIDVDPDWL